jgi:hypothetical protein
MFFSGVHELGKGLGYAFWLRKMGQPNSNTNKYLYNGKELQEELGQYDYSFLVIVFSGIHELGSA